MNEEVCTVEQFHALCHSLAEDYGPWWSDAGRPFPARVGQGIKSLICGNCQASM